MHVCDQQSISSHHHMQGLLFMASKLCELQVRVGSAFRGSRSQGMEPTGFQGAGVTSRISASHHQQVPGTLHWRYRGRPRRLLHMAAQYDASGAHWWASEEKQHHHSMLPGALTMRCTSNLYNITAVLHLRGLTYAEHMLVLLMAIFTPDPTTPESPKRTDGNHKRCDWMPERVRVPYLCLAES